MCDFHYQSTIAYRMPNWCTRVSSRGGASAQCPTDGDANVNDSSQNNDFASLFTYSWRISRMPNVNNQSKDQLVTAGITAQTELCLGYSSLTRKYKSGIYSA